MEAYSLILLKVLGLTPPVTETDIKKAYRSLALEHHPDKGGDAEKFIEVTSAYEALLAFDSDDFVHEPRRCECETCLGILYVEYMFSLPSAIHGFWKRAYDVTIEGIFNTPYGRNMLVTAVPPQSFWKMWQSDKAYIKAHSMSVSKNAEDQWRMCLWVPWED